MMQTYKLEVSLGVTDSRGTHHPLMTWLEAPTDSAAISIISRLSASLSLPHTIYLNRCLGITPVTQIFKRDCEANEIW
jgi:hypothetical protein